MFSGRPVPGARCATPDSRLPTPDYLRHMTPVDLELRAHPIEHVGMQRPTVSVAGPSRGRRMCACCCRAVPTASDAGSERHLACSR